MEGAARWRSYNRWVFSDSEWLHLTSPLLQFHILVFSFIRLVNNSWHYTNETVDTSSLGIAMLPQCVCGRKFRKTGHLRIHEHAFWVQQLMSISIRRRRKKSRKLGTVPETVLREIRDIPDAPDNISRSASRCRLASLLIDWSVWTSVNYIWVLRIRAVPHSGKIKMFQCHIRRQVWY